MAGPNFEAMIATLKGERDQVVAQYDAAIAALVNISTGQMTLDASSPSSSRQTHAPTLVRPYRGMSVPRAAEEHLRAVNRSLAAPEIARAIREGGVVTKAKHFTPIVYNAMSSRPEKFRRDYEGDRPLWSLKEWPAARVA